MNRPADLFDLIKSMTRSEKRYFKLSASPQKGEKNYLRLFDAIDRQKSYDEEAIKRTFQGEAFVKQLHVAKNYLFKLILRSLRAYRAESSVDAQIECLLQDARILHDKGLGRLCAASLKRARGLAEEYERDIALLEIIRMEDACIPAKSPTDPSNSVPRKSQPDDGKWGIEADDGYEVDPTELRNLASKMHSEFTGWQQRLAKVQKIAIRVLTWSLYLLARNCGMVNILFFR